MAGPKPPRPGLAGQTDPGVTHTQNHDAFALSGPALGGHGAILVLCDSVSNSQTPDLAAATAARTAHEVLVTGGAMLDAIRRAHEAVCALPFDRQAELDPPAITIVAARLHGGGATIGWLGDSRAYTLDAGGGGLLTRDHSWLSAVLDRGEMTQAEAPATRAPTLCCIVSAPRISPPPALAPNPA